MLHQCDHINLTTMKTFTIQSKFAAVTFIAILFVIIACEKENTLFPSMERNLTGQWKFEKVTFHKDFSLSWNNITNEYQDVTVEFFADNTINYTNLGAGEQLNGNWEITNYWEYYGDEQYRVVHKLVGNLSNTQSGETKDLNWDNLNVTKKKITCKKRANSGTYSYKLVKL